MGHFDPVYPHEDVIAHIERSYSYKDGKIYSRYWMDEVGNIHNQKCRYVISIKTKSGKTKTVKRAHVVWFLCKKEWPKHELDHINRDKLDDSIDNLRYSNRSQQQINKSHKNNKTGRRGVYRVKRGYQVQLWKDNVRYIVGYFKDKEIAYARYEEKYIELWGHIPS